MLNYSFKLTKLVNYVIHSASSILDCSNHKNHSFIYKKSKLTVEFNDPESENVFCNKQLVNSLQMILNCVREI